VTDGAKSVKEHMVGKDEPQTMGEKLGTKVDEAAAAASEQKAKASEAVASGVDKLKEQLGGRGDEPKAAEESK
jgi:hypothetical protein